MSNDAARQEGVAVIYDQDQKQRPPECEHICFWRQKSELATDDVSSLLEPCYNYCESDLFQKLLNGLGFHDVSFTRNSAATPGQTLYDKFQNTWPSLESDATLGIVFHGTQGNNISHILQNGLDKTLRKGQCYGPGEYFSCEAGISIGYCRGGLKMLVFVVVLPPKESRKRIWPKDYVVIEDNDHQYPLGVIEFKSVNQQVVSRSVEQKDQLRQLSKQVYEKAKVAREAALKAEIIRKIFERCIDISAEMYLKHQYLLTHHTKREIAYFVHLALDEDVVDAYFPGLPEPMKSDEHDRAPIMKVEEAEKQALAFQNQLDTTLASITGNILGRDM